MVQMIQFLVAVPVLKFWGRMGRKSGLLQSINHISQKHFTLAQVQNLLGKAYTIRRLNRHGRLDNNLAQTWNCVAVPAHLQGKV
jgi:hypothetical protein